MDQSKTFNFNKYWGPSEYRPRVVFRRNSEMLCVFCGKQARTREHSPSLAYLNKPYPLNLPTVPSCEKCNNSFSSDELYTKAFIQVYEHYFSYKTKTLSSDRKEIKEAEQKLNEIINSNAIYFDDRISNVLIKLSICHLAYELTTGFFDETWKGIPEYIECSFRPHMRYDEIEQYDNYVIMNENILPIIGSRAFNHIYVVEQKLKNTNSGEVISTQHIVMDWIVVQEKKYRYVCWLDNKHMYVKIVIDEFLFANIIFNQIQ
jgi:hypothetical protein